MERLDRYIELLNQKTPGVKIRFKNESFLMKLLAILLFFNSNFTQKFVTTVGKTIYFPSKEWLSTHEEKTILTLVSHEYQHIRDNVRLKILFSFVYLFPLSLIPIFLLSALLFSNFIFIILALLCLAPAPAPGRMYLEVRGYSMSLFAYNCLAKEIGMSLAARTDMLISKIDFMNEQFTSSNYYFMWPFGVKKKLLNNLNIFLREEEKDAIYVDVSEALLASKQ